MRKTLALGATALTAASLALAAPASADSATVVLAVGLADTTLSITAPTAVVVPGSPAVATIATTIADLRLTGTGWTSTISSTNLSMAGVPATADNTITAASMTAYTGDVEATLPTVTIGSEYTSGSPLTLSTSAQPLLTATGRTNVNTSVFTTTVVIPTAGKDTGVYTGTVTQSVT
jgi:hypothetical protein